MSAWIVSKRHIDYMLTAGLIYPQYGKLEWFVPHENKPTDYARGQRWGPTAVLTAVKHIRELTRETADEVGRMLWKQNYESVNYRYDEEPTVEAKQPYTYEPVPEDEMDILDAIKLTLSYEYQSCETPDWEYTEAYRFAESLIRELIHRIPGMDKAKWSI